MGAVISWILGSDNKAPEQPKQVVQPEEPKPAVPAPEPKETPANPEPTNVAPAQDPKPEAPKPAPAKKVIDRSIFVQKNKTDETIVRVPGQINGNQFLANTLTNCKVIVHDFCDSMTLDNCKNCDFVLAAVRGSIFARKCENCRFMMVCGQFRCRECFNCDFYMQVKTGPVIESSNNLRIGCGLVAYPELLEHMKKAKLENATNIWNDIHDFTPGDSPNFELCPGKKLEMEINELDGDLNVFYTYGRDPEAVHFAVTIKEEKTAELAKLSVSDLKLAATERSDAGIVCIVAAESQEAAEEMFKALEPVEVKLAE